MRQKVMNPKGLKIEPKYQQEKVIIHPNGYQGLAGFHKYWGKKPTEAWRFLIDNFTESGDIVLDPFLGSGLIARECIDLKRRFIGFDLNPISIELTKLYLDLPDYSTLKKAINEIFYNIKPQIDIIYRIPSGEIISHFLWKGK